MRDFELSQLSRAGIASVSGAVREAIHQAVFRLARRAILSVSSATGDDFAEGYQVAPTDPQGQAAARKFQHYGYRSRPLTRSELITVALHGLISNRVYIASESPGVGPDDQVEGEVEVYSTFGQRVRLRADGSLRLEVAAGAWAELRPDGSVVLAESGGGAAALAQGRLTVTDDVACRHALGTGATPTTVGTPGFTTAVAVGTDRLFRVTMVVGANPAPPGLSLFAATFAAPYAGAALGQVTQESGAGKKYSAAVTATGVVVTADEQFDAGTTTVFVVSTGGVA